MIDLKTVKRSDIKIKWDLRREPRECIASLGFFTKYLVPKNEISLSRFDVKTYAADKAITSVLHKIYSPELVRELVGIRRELELRHRGRGTEDSSADLRERLADVIAQMRQ